MNKCKYKLYREILELKDIVEETQLKYLTDKTQEEYKKILAESCIQITNKYDLLKSILLKEFIEKYGR